MKNKLASFIFIELFGIILLIAGVMAVWEDAIFDINQATVVTGEVVAKDIISTKKRKSPKLLFCFMLNNITQKFTVYRVHQGYTDLEYEIDIGDTLKVYFEPATSFYNTKVYQIEKGRKVLVSYRTIRDNESNNRVLLLFSGIILIIAGVFTYYKINWLLFLMRLADPDYKRDTR